MIISATKPDYQPAPTGQYAAVCVDVVDMGMIDVTFEGKTKKVHKVRIVWQINKNREDGKPFIVQKRYTASLNEKATLRSDLESWRGQAFADDELIAFDLDNIIGAPAYLNIIHVKKGDATFANVKTIMPLPDGMKAPVPRDYIRVCKRPMEGDQAA